MIRSFSGLVLVGIFASQARAQNPAPSSPPANPPTPTPIPTVVPATPVTAAPAQTGAPTIVLDNFDSVSQWVTAPAEGVEVSVHPEPNGLHGGAMRVDFDFHGHGGYAVIRRPLTFALPQNYEFSFAIKGDAPTNTLEFKLVDSTGDNVWWSNNPNFHFPKDWTTFSRKKRQISFAWGPTSDRDLKRFAAVEIAITAGSGGKGRVWLDDFVLTPLDPAAPYNLFPRITASTQAQGYDVTRTLDADAMSGWRNIPRASTGSVSSVSGIDTINIDFQKRREFGGMVISWEPGRRANSYEVQASKDGQSWQTIYTVNRASSPPTAQNPTPANKTDVATSPLYKDYLYLPESDARFVRVILTSGENRNGYGIRDISVKPLEWAATENDLYFALARDSRRDIAALQGLPIHSRI